MYRRRVPCRPRHRIACRETATRGASNAGATLWELAWLINSEAMARTIVMMPSVAWVHRRRVRDGWSAAAPQHGFALLDR
jgi:hypothetical protein